MIDTIGLGSFFHYIASDDLSETKEVDFLNTSRIFYTGRHAFRYLLDALQAEQEIDTIWLPTYYCQHVTHWLNQVYPNIKYYEVSPFEENNRIQPDKFKENDILILNNFWGISTLISEEFASSGPITIEDHSHGWLSEQSKTSKADYCMASLRKSLPVPMGGILWIPKDSKKTIPELKGKEDKEFYRNWDKALKAMRDKFEFQQHPGAEKTYLSEYGEVESYLHEQYDYVEVLPEHQQYIEPFISVDYSAYKKRNLEHLFSLLQGKPNFKVINVDNRFTFGLNLAFRSEKDMKELKTHLIRNYIYPSELWPGNTISDEFRYLLNIHVDFRYGKEEMNHIAASINAWNP